MKITKEKLMEIIEAELMENEPAPEEPAPKHQADTDKVLQYISKIDNKYEYEELLTAVVTHGDNIPNKKLILTTLYKKLPSIIKGLK